MTSVGYKEWLQINHSKGNPNNLSNRLELIFNLTEPVQLLSFNLAADYTVDLINKNYNNLHLSLSGGLDSEFIAKVLVRNKIKFTPVILITPTNVSALETWYAYKFCDENSLVPKLLDYSDIENYIELLKKMIKINDQLKIPMNAGSFAITIANEIKDSTVLNGYGEPFYNSESYQEAMGDILDIHDNNFWSELYFGNSHPGAFFSYTPELFRACIKDIDTTKNSQVAKAELYGLVPRPKILNLPYDYCPDPTVQKIINSLRKKLYKPWELQSIKIHKNDLLDKLNNE